MKLRTTHNSIRIRVKKSELALLKERQTIEESISFPSSPKLGFAVVIGDHQEELNAMFKDHKIVLSISSEKAKEWMNTNLVGIETHIGLANNEQLHLLIEKDFPCKDRIDEDKSDTFEDLAPNDSVPC